MRQEALQKEQIELNEELNALKEVGTRVTDSIKCMVNLLVLVRFASSLHARMHHVRVHVCVVNIQGRHGGT